MSKLNWEEVNIPDHWTLEHVQAAIELMDLHMKWFQQVNHACKRCRVECVAQLPTAERSALDHRYRLFLERANQLDGEFPGLIAHMQAEDTFPHFGPNMEPAYRVDKNGKPI